MLVWKEGNVIYYYAAGYTDSGKKIPLASDSACMFSGCKGLKAIDLSGCDSLVGGQGISVSGINSSAAGLGGILNLFGAETFAHIDGGSSDPGYFTAKP